MLAIFVASVLSLCGAHVHGDLSVQIQCYEDTKLKFNDYFKSAPEKLEDQSAIGFSESEGNKTRTRVSCLVDQLTYPKRVHIHHQWELQCATAYSANLKSFESRTQWFLNGTEVKQHENKTQINISNRKSQGQGHYTCKQLYLHPIWSYIQTEVFLLRPRAPRSFTINCHARANGKCTDLKLDNIELVSNYPAAVAVDISTFRVCVYAHGIKCQHFSMKELFQQQADDQQRLSGYKSHLKTEVDLTTIKDKSVTLQNVGIDGTFHLPLVVTIEVTNNIQLTSEKVGCVYG